MTDQSGRQARRQTIAQQALVGCCIVGAICGAGYALVDEMDLKVPSALIAAACAVLVPGALIPSIIYWRNIDEAAREAHKFAWFWGGSCATLLVLPLAFLVGDIRLVAWMGQRSPSEWVLFGVMSLTIAQLAGYGLAWAGWWLRQR